MVGHRVHERARPGPLGCRRFGPPARGRKNGWSEPSGTIVHRVLGELDAEHRVIVWNTVPTHPHKPGQPLSNRRPTVTEIEAGAVYAERLLEMVRPRVIVAVGRVAEEILGPRATYVRHPANGGATAFAAGIARLLARTSELCQLRPILRRE